MKIYKIWMGSIMMVLIFNLSSATAAEHLHPEKAYQAKWCAENGGVIEHRMNDGIADCVTPEHVVEFDFASKWPEAVGQILYYAAITKKKPLIVLILENPEDEKYFKRLKTVADQYGIDVKVMRPSDLKKSAKPKNP